MRKIMSACGKCSKTEDFVIATGKSYTIKDFIMCVQKF